MQLTKKLGFTIFLIAIGILLLLWPIAPVMTTKYRQGLLNIQETTSMDLPTCKHLTKELILSTQQDTAERRILLQTLEKAQTLNAVRILNTLAGPKKLYRIAPLPSDPLATLPFQFGQGEFGWYWFYGTWPKTQQLGSFCGSTCRRYLCKVACDTTAGIGAAACAPAGATGIGLVACEAGVKAAQKMCTYACDHVGKKTPAPPPPGPIQSVPQRENLNVMFYVIRSEMTGIKKSRPAETQTYFISVGVGYGKKWIQFSDTYQGTWTSNNKGIKLSLDGTHTMEYSYEEKKWTFAFAIEKESVVCTAEWKPLKTTPPSFNNKKGCAPCSFGLGTNYWSMPQLVTTCQLPKLFGNTTSSVFDAGDGWMDRQWMNTNIKYPSNILAKAMVDTSSLLSRGSRGGLGKYVWITIHWKYQPNNDGEWNRVQYMVWAMLKDTWDAVPGGDVPGAKANMYYNKEVSSIASPRFLIKDVNVKILEVVRLEDVQYPIKYSISLPDPTGQMVTFEVNGGDYGGGKCVTKDQTGNDHYTGSASLTQKNVNVGTAFVEASKFTPTDKFDENTLLSAGIKNKKDQSQIVMTTKPNVWEPIFIIGAIVLFVVLVRFTRPIKMKHFNGKR